MGQSYPSPITAAMLADANTNAGKPRYLAADYVVGVSGDDTDTSTASVTIANDHGGANEADYAPRNQQAKATRNAGLTPPTGGANMGTSLAVDISRQRGFVAPGQPYPSAASPALVAPVVSSISPTTGAATALPMVVTITGTGFTPWSVVLTGGSTLPDSSGQYISATQMKVAIWKASPGTVSVAVEDHNVISNTNVVFTVT